MPKKNPFKKITYISGRSLRRLKKREERRKPKKKDGDAKKEQ